MFIAAITSGNANSWIAVALLIASVRNFKRNPGPVAGLFKACRGLSAAVFVAVCETLFTNSASAYLMMLIVAPTTFCLISAIFFQPVSSAETQEEQDAEQTSLHIFNVMICCLAVYTAALTLIPTANFTESSMYKFFAMGLLIAIVGAPALVPIVLMSKVKEIEDVDHKQNEVVRYHEEHEADIDSRISSPVLDHNCPRLLDDAILEPEKQGLHQPLLDNVTGELLLDKPQRKLAKWRCCEGLSSWSFRSIEELGEDTPTLSLFKTWHFYVLYFSLFCGAGSVGTFCSNLAQVGQSFGFSNTNLFAALYSLGNFSGMLASGNVSEYFLRMTNMPRPAWMGLVKLPMPVLFLWFSTGSRASLYVGSPLLGFCLGSLITLSIPIVSEFYGLKHFSTNFPLTITYYLTGFSTLAGYLYDREALAAGEERDSLTCHSAECFGTTFQIMACFLTVALARDALLTVYSKPLYHKLKS